MSEVNPMCCKPVTVPVPTTLTNKYESRVKSCGPETAAPKLMVLPLESIVTGPPTRVNPPVNVKPSYPLRIFPSAPPVVTNPVKVEPTLPAPKWVRVTSSAKLTVPVAVIPERACTVLPKVTAPEPWRISAAPVPSPFGVIAPTAPVKVLIPVPELIVRSLLPSSVSPKITFELTVVMVVLTPTTTGLLKVMTPVAVLVSKPLSKILPEVAV